MKTFAGRARDVGASQVRSTTSMWGGRSNIGQVLDDAEILLVTLEWRESLGQLIQCACFGGIKSLLSEAVAHPAKDHPGGRLGQGRGRRQRIHACQPRQGEQGAPRGQEVSTRKG